MRAVVKCDGYNWGARRLARALEDACAAFCVADVDEFFSLRAATRRPIVLLGAIDPSALAPVLAEGGIPTISSRDELALATEWSASSGRRLMLRVGVRPAAGWSGLDLPAIAALAPELADEDLEIEVWTHVTGAAAAAEQIARLQEAAALLRRAGVNVAGIDSGSTFSCADRSAIGETARIGIGLFGATGGPKVPGVACALRLDAPVVRVETFPAGTRLGYGSRVLSAPARVATLRCGYGDGYPKDAGGEDDILSVGMQYALLRAGDGPVADDVRLLGEGTDLDAFALRAGRGVHEIVTTLGSAARDLEER